MSLGPKINVRTKRNKDLDAKWVFIKQFKNKNIRHYLMLTFDKYPFLTQLGLRADN